MFLYKVQLVFIKLQIPLEINNYPNNIRLPTSLKYYLYFQTYGKTARESRCDKSGAQTKFVVTIISTVYF